MASALSVLSSGTYSDWADASTSSNSGPYQKGNGNYQPGGYSYNDNRQSSEEAQTEEGEIRPRHKKLFSKDEGEYVDFEEIKE